MLRSERPLPDRSTSSKNGLPSSPEQEFTVHPAMLPLAQFVMTAAKELKPIMRSMDTKYQIVKQQNRTAARKHPGVDDQRFPSGL